MLLVHPYTEKTEGGRLLHNWYNYSMEDKKKFIVFVMQSGIDKKDIFVSETTENPEDVVERYNSSQNPKQLTKPLGSMLPLTLRLDLSGSNNVFDTQAKALEYRKQLTEEFERQKFTYTVRSKRSYFFGKKKSVKNKQTGKYTLNLDPSLYQGSDSMAARDSGRKDVMSYGRKKSAEWNDDKAVQFEQALADKLKKRKEDS